MPTRLQFTNTHENSVHILGIMKQKSLFLIPVLFLAGCGDEEASTESLSQVEPIEYGSELYDEAQAYMADADTDIRVMINEANAYQVTSFENTPESVVAYFYASFIRKDLEWQKVCLPYEEQSPEFKNTIEQYSTWRDLKYTPQGSQGSDVLFKLEFIDMNGEADHGDRVITVEEIDGKDLVTTIPAF